MRPPRRPQVEELEPRAVPSAAPAHPPAVPSYTIRVHDLGAGQSGQVTDQSTDVLALQAKTAGGVVFLQHQETTGSNFAYRETVLQKPAGAVLPTRLQRLYQTARQTDGGTTTVLPYQGKVVLITRQADGYHFQVPGGSPAANEAAQALADEFNGPAAQVDPLRLLLPSRPVAVHQSWAINPRALLPALDSSGATFGTAGASGAGTLTRVYQQNGHRFGTLAFVLTLPIRSLPLGPFGTVAATPGSKAVLRITADGCIDGSVDTGSVRTDLQITAGATVSAPGGMRLQVSLTDHATDTVTHQQLTPPVRGGL